VFALAWGRFWHTEKKVEALLKAWALVRPQGLLYWLIVRRWPLRGGQLMASSGRTSADVEWLGR